MQSKQESKKKKKEKDGEQEGKPEKEEERSDPARRQARAAGAQARAAGHTELRSCGISALATGRIYTRKMMQSEKYHVYTEQTINRCLRKILKTVKAKNVSL